MHSHIYTVINICWDLTCQFFACSSLIVKLTLWKFSGESLTSGATLTCLSLKTGKPQATWAHCCAERTERSRKSCDLTGQTEGVCSAETLLHWGPGPFCGFTPLVTLLQTCRPSLYRRRNACRNLWWFLIVTCLDQDLPTFHLASWRLGPILWLATCIQRYLR